MSNSFKQRKKALKFAERVKAIGSYKQLPDLPPGAVATPNRVNRILSGHVPSCYKEKPTDETTQV